jgi:hypothetical protein
MALSKRTVAVFVTYDSDIVNTEDLCTTHEMIQAGYEGVDAVYARMATEDEERTLPVFPG